MLAAVSLTNKCYNVKIAGTNPWRINNTVSGEYDNRINRNGGNTFSVDFDYEGPPSTTGNLPNPNGIVTLSLRPYNAYTIPQGNSWVQTRAASDVATFPHTYRVNFGDPVSPYPNNVAFLCATMTLSGFLHDDIPWDNSLNINYNYIHTSDYSQSVAIGIDSAPGLRRGDTATLLLRFVSRNDPSAIQQGALPGNPSSFAGRNQGAGRSATWFLLAGASFVAGLRLRRRRSMVALTVVVGIFAVSQGCRFIPGTQEPVPSAHWQVPNATALGLRPLPNEPGWYAMPTRVGRESQLQLQFSGFALPYKTQTVRLVAGDSSGRPDVWRTAVRPGQIVSVFAFGRIDLDGDGPIPPTAAGGFVRNDSVTRTLAVAAPPPYLLSIRRYAPQQYAGALIGSFDGFETSFVIGTNASFAVPERAQQLSLAVNARSTDYRTAVGAYEIKFIVVPPPSAPTAIRATVTTTLDWPTLVPSWEVLSGLSLYTYYDFATQQNGRLLGHTRVPLGAAHFSIYQSDVQ